MNTLVVRLSLGPFCDVIKLIWKRPKCIPMLLTYLNSRGPYIMLYVLRSDSKKSLHTFLPITQIQIALVKNHKKQ